MFDTKRTKEKLPKEAPPRYATSFKKVSPPPPPGQLSFQVLRGDKVIKFGRLHDFSETKIVTHGGKITFIETSTKEKVE